MATDAELRAQGLDPASRARFGWDDADVVLRDNDGEVITPRRAKELQLERLRSEVEQDVAADAESGAETSA